MGPEIVLRLLVEKPERGYRAVLVAELAALAASAHALGIALPALTVAAGPDDLADETSDLVLLDPVGEEREVVAGRPGAADARGALAALDRGIEIVAGGFAQALVTGPISKQGIAEHVLPGFVGHTDYLAAAAGLERYGRDYLMTFLSQDLQVALLSTHLPLERAIREIRPEGIAAALVCLDRHAGGRIGVAGLDPHAGEGGLLGTADEEIVRPGVELARQRGVDAVGPWSADSIFARARRGEVDWVLALYHDQGLIAVKTVAFGTATNWTLGLPWIRTSVDHGTAYDLAGTGRADVEPLRRVVATTLDLLAGRLPRGTRAQPPAR